MTFESILTRALDGARELRVGDPSWIYLSVETQLQYLLGLVHGTDRDWSKLREITLGILAVREIEDRDSELADSS